MLVNNSDYTQGNHENLAILAYIADKSGKLLAKDGLERWRALESTAFMTTEIHRGFTPFFRNGTDQEKQQAVLLLGTRFGTISEQLGDKAFLVGEEVTIADCYLFVMLSWAVMMGVPLPERLDAYLVRMKALPSVARMLQAEGLA